MTDDSKTPAEVDEVCRDKLAAMWAHAGFHSVAYPVATTDVVRMLDRCDYRADHDFILDLMNRGILQVARVAGHRAWQAEDCMRAVVELEGRRRWKWPSAVHGMKFSQAERMQAEAEAAGKLSCFNDVHTLDVESLLIHLASAETFAVRDALRVAVLARLKLESMP